MAERIDQNFEILKYNLRDYTKDENGLIKALNNDFYISNIYKNYYFAFSKSNKKLYLFENNVKNHKALPLSFGKSGYCAFHLDDTKTYLLHNGKRHHISPLIFDNEKYPKITLKLVNGRKNHYNRVADISDPNIFNLIVDYHLAFDAAKNVINTNELNDEDNCDDLGPAGDGTRSAGKWNGRHSKYCTIIRNELSKFKLQPSKNNWKPDICRKNLLGKEIIIEVKPDCTTRDVISAIGQLMVYSYEIENPSLWFAAPGTSDMQAKLREQLKRFDIEIIDLSDENEISPQVQKILDKLRKQ